MKKILSNARLSKLIVLGAIAVNILLALSILGLKLNVTNKNVWGSAGVDVSVSIYPVLSIIFIVLFIICIILLVYAIYTFLKKEQKGLYILTIYNLCMHLVFLFTQIATGMFKGFAVFLIIVELLLSFATIAFLIIYKSFNKINEKDNVEIKQSFSITKMFLLIISILTIAIYISMFFVPLFFLSNGEISYEFIVIDALTENYEIGNYITFIVMFLVLLALLMYFVNSLTTSNNEKTFCKKIRNIVNIIFSGSIVFFLVGYFISFYFKIEGYISSTISFIPLILMFVVLIIFSIISGKEKLLEKEIINKKKKFKIEPLIYLVLLTVVTYLSLFIVMIRVDFQFFGTNNVIELNGIELLTDYVKLGESYQLMAFVIFSMILISSILLVVSLCSYFSKNIDCYKIIKVSSFLNVLFALILGLSGFYYQIAQKINEENILSLVSSFGFTITENYKYEVTSQSIYMMIIAIVILLVAIFRKSFNIDIEEDKTLSLEMLPNESSFMPQTFKTEPQKQVNEDNDLSSTSKKTIEDFDACPAFSEIDEMQDVFVQELSEKTKVKYQSPTLPGLVKFVVDYARESRLHLSYTPEDIATFVAGLGASRLAILQGMSGTGKTSLPKIFMEAIMGNCEIVEVEASWRDKNELLGYYNEFTKSFTPKKFTQYLYKAKLNPEVPTFIVLDEMNLSRIEYYFSDFLSLMEHEEDKREIKLLNVKLFRYENEEKIEYSALTNGHTLKIPSNVWFIGTANRDESTFEISDKVYDRAQTMNFNKRAPKVRIFIEPLSQKFVTYSDLSMMLHNAIIEGTFEVEDSKIVKEVEKLLQPYNISFGNRILKQMEEFVNIYCACFNNDQRVVNDAIEKILLSKVVSKLEYKNIENKERLANQFKELNLKACYEFISKLNED